MASSFKRPESATERGYHSDTKLKNAGHEPPKTIGGVHRTNKIIKIQNLLGRSYDDFASDKIDLKNERKNNRNKKKHDK